VTKLADSMPEIERRSPFDHGFGHQFHDRAMSVGIRQRLKEFGVLIAP
jgi:hypothetical protein